MPNRETTSDDRSSLRPPGDQVDPGIGSIVNLGLIVLAFALLGLVLWQNRDKIREVFSHPLDLRLLGLGVLDLPVQPESSLTCAGISWFG